MAVIFRNATILVEDGGVHEVGVFPSYGAQFNFHARAREIDVDWSMDTTDTKGGADDYSQNRYHTKKGNIKLTGVVSATNGYSFKGMGEEPPLGRIFRITTKPSSSLATSDIFVGVCTKWHMSGKDGDATMEDIELDATPAID